MSHIRTTRRHAGVLIMALAAGALQPMAPAAARGQVARDPARLTLGALYRRLDDGNPRIAAARAAARAAEARAPGARRPPDPELQIGFMNRELPSLKPMEPLGMTQIQLMQMLPLGGKLGLGGRIADAQADAAGNRAAEVRWETRARVAMAFHDLVEAERRLAIDSATLRLVQDLAQTTRSMYAVGEGRQSDVLRAQVEIARMGEELVRMRAMRAAMLARLGGILDGEVDTLAQALPPRLPDALPPLDSLQRMAGRDRPMLRAALDELRAAEDATRLARREIWPDLQVGVQYGWRDGAMGTERMGSLMLGATVPVFARSRQLRMREEASAMRAMADADVAAMRAETRARVAELHADIVRARNLAALYRTTVLPQATAAVTSALAAYRVGDVPFMQVLDNQMTVNRYQQELVSLDAQQGRALGELEMLVGRELFDANVLGADEAGRPR